MRRLEEEFMIACRRLLPLAIASVLCTIGEPAWAQITTASVAGTVKDPQGAVVPGAAVMLISETRGTQPADVFTNVNGDFTFVNVPPDRYTIQVTIEGFKTLKRTGLVVSAGDRLGLGPLAIDVGTLTESMTVKAESPLVQTQSGERSFTIATESVENLPIANRSFTALASLAPGVTTTGDPARLGGGGDTNIMMDGIGVMDTGSNRPLLQMNVESIAEVKVLTSSYQAEYGRSSGLQITAVTKSGTNRFRGAVYDVERNSDWNANSKVNTLNGDPKTVLKQKDWGFSIGGPIGKPGGANKLFFFYSQEFEPRTGGNDVRRFRMPTSLERAGDFSQTLDQNGARYPFIRDPASTAPCSASNTAGCFQDGGVLGRIPANRLYDMGLNILKLYPLPNIDGAGLGYNYQITRPEERILSWQPAIRFDYQPTSTLRTTFKYSGWQQRRQAINGTLPGFNDTEMQNPVISSFAVSANYNLNETTYVEATYGRSRNELAGCALAQSGTGPTFCRAAIPMNPNSNRLNAGLGNLPLLFPDANKLNPAYYATQALNGMSPVPPAWVNGDFLKLPTFAWGSRIANGPPSVPFPSYFNVNATNDFSISLTKVTGRHTMKTGFFRTHSFKAENATDVNSFGALSFAQNAVGTNAFDTSFRFANAAIGSFSSYQQASTYVEGDFVYSNVEGYIQDNWKVNSRLTLDYGVRLVHQEPQFDELGQAANFLPDRWSLGTAPVLYLPGCVNASPCTGTNRQALNPVTGQLLGPNTTLAIGTLVPNSGNTIDGLFLGGQGIADTTYTFPTLGVAPRFGVAYDVTGQQKLVVRGGGGLFFDRPFGNSVISMPGNPPASKLVTVRYGQLQALGTGGLTTQAAPALNTIQYDAKLPSSWQWNGGIQMEIPWSTAIDAEYVGQHSFNTVREVDINAVDFGSAFLARNQDPTLSPTTPGATSFSSDLMRAYRGYSAITHRLFDGWRTFHSLQLSLNRRFKDGLSFGLNDTWVLYDHEIGEPRLQHNADGSYAFRADQAQATDMLSAVIPNRHIVKGHFVWDLPDVHGTTPVVKAVALAVNDWQLSGIWTASTGGAYDVDYSYSSGGSNVNITGSANYGGRVKIVGDPGGGCSSNPYRQFNTAAFEGPPIGSVGLDSGAGYLRGCFRSVIDLAIARNIRFGGGRTLQLRVDMFNALNSSIVADRNTTLELSSPTDPGTITNLPYDANGDLIATRSLPKNAGFGVASAYQNPRTIQILVRFGF